MKDPSVVVRDTTAWTVGRICELLPEAAINEMYLPPLLQCLIEGLGAEPRVASNVCWVSLNLRPSHSDDVADRYVGLEPPRDPESRGFVRPAGHCLRSSQQAGCVTGFKETFAVSRWYHENTDAVESNHCPRTKLGLISVGCLADAGSGSSHSVRQSS